MSARSWRVVAAGAVRCSARLIAVTAALALATPARAQGPIFQWVDRQGNLNLSDELADVPEPYRSMYAAKLREAAEARKQAPSQAAAPAAAPAPAPRPTASPEAPAPSIIDQEAARRQRWKEQVATWRAELAAATQALADADTHLGELESNAMLAQTPSVAAEIAKARDVRAATLARVEKARSMLLTDLPARAKREGVPAAWLM